LFQPLFGAFSYPQPCNHVTDSVALGGLAGVSDTLAAALWLLDYSFELAAAGGTGVNWMISYCRPYSPIIDGCSTCDCGASNSTRANAPYRHAGVCDSCWSRGQGLGGEVGCPLLGTGCNMLGEAGVWEVRWHQGALAHSVYVGSVYLMVVPTWVPPAAPSMICC
jgi:hypothetical protein